MCVVSGSAPVFLLWAPHVAMAQTSPLLPILESQQTRRAEEREFVWKKNQALLRMRKIRRRGRQMLRMRPQSDSEGWLSESESWSTDWDEDLDAPGVIIIDDSDSDAQNEGSPSFSNAAAACADGVELDDDVTMRAEDDDEVSTDDHAHRSLPQAVLLASTCSQDQSPAEWLLDAQLRTAILCGSSIEI